MFRLTRQSPDSSNQTPLNLGSLDPRKNLSAAMGAASSHDAITQVGPPAQSARQNQLEGCVDMSGETAHTRRGYARQQRNVDINTVKA